MHGAATAIEEMLRKCDHDRPDCWRKALLYIPYDACWDCPCSFARMPYLAWCMPALDHVCCDPGSLSHQLSTALFLRDHSNNQLVASFRTCFVCCLLRVLIIRPRFTSFTPPTPTPSPHTQGLGPDASTLPCEMKGPIPGGRGHCDLSISVSRRDCDTPT